MPIGEDKYTPVTKLDEIDWYIIVTDYYPTLGMSSLRDIHGTYLPENHSIGQKISQLTKISLYINFPPHDV